MSPEYGLISLAALFFLYAETHYSFKGIYSRLKKKEPEIIADLPHRINPNQSIPLLLLVKDAHQFPIHLQRVLVELRGNAQRERLPFEFDHELVNDRLWYKILPLRPQKDFAGPVRVNVVVDYLIRGRRRTARNDNYAGTSHAPLEVYLSDQDLPGTANWHFGEFHAHTSFTSDQVEFGAPPEAAAQLAEAMGLSFFCATDHSYDLDDEPDNYLKTDPTLSKWTALQDEIKRLNEINDRFVIVPGEEVSAGNHRRRNVHFLILNHPEFIPGKGDSAEKWLRTKPDLGIDEILAGLEPAALAFAAHPETRPPFLEWLLIRRGKWEGADYRHARLNGLQIWNGTESELQTGIRRWVELLLQGRRIHISGGNDAHGNFNRFRQIGFPFFSMREHHEHLFGRVRTGLYLEGKPTLQNVLQAIREGRMMVTNGPFLDCILRHAGGRRVGIGGNISGEVFSLKVRCLSSPEFGPLQKLTIWVASLLKKREEVLKEVTTFGAPPCYDHNVEFECELTGPNYIRAELLSESEGERYRCLTNPIWVNLEGSSDDGEVIR